MDNENLSLYNITEELDDLDALLEMDEGEIGDDMEALVNEIELILSNKTDSVVGYIQKQDDLIAIATSRIKALQDYQKSKKNKIERFKSYVFECIKKTGREKFTGSINSIKLRKPTDVINIIDQNKVPVEYLVSKTTITVDKSQAKRDLKNNKAVAGCELVKSSPSLIIGLNKKGD